MTFDALDARMHVFEIAHDYCVLPGMYMVARLDGRSCTRLTREVHQFAAPFDERFRDLMVETTAHVMQYGFRMLYGYTPSDEISLLVHRDEQTFGRKLRKYESVLARRSKLNHARRAPHIQEEGAATMIRTLDLVALLENLPESRLRRGDVGIVVTWHIAAAQYDVEFSATTERSVTLVTLREDQLLKLNQAPAALSLYAPVAEHWQKAMEMPSAESESELEEAHTTSLVRVPVNISLHDLLHLVCIHRPTDFAPYGIRQREAADCSCGCKHYVTLAGTLGADWGVCTNPRSPRAGLLTFEHQGCEFFEYDERIDQESE